jgi:hypothetical protein
MQCSGPLPDPAPPYVEACRLVVPSLPPGRKPLLKCLCDVVTWPKVTTQKLLWIFVLQVWGVDLVEEHLLCSCGIPSRPPVAARPLTQLAEYSVNAHKSGTVQSTDFLKVRDHTSLVHSDDADP